MLNECYIISRQEYVSMSSYVVHGTFYHVFTQTYKRSELSLSKELRHKLFHHYIFINDYKRSPIGRPRACRVGCRIACILEHLVKFVRKCDEMLFCVSAFNSGSRRSYGGYGDIHIITNCDVRYYFATCNVVGCG